MFCIQKLTVGNTTWTKEGSRPWYRVIGYCVRFGSKFWAWNSFAQNAYLSDKNHMEVLSSRKKAEDWKDKNSAHGVVVELISYESPWFK